MNHVPSPSSRRFVVLQWLCWAAAIAYACRNGLGVAESTIRGDLQLTKETMGLVMALFFVPYALGQLPGGWLADAWGSRRSIPLFAVGWSIATIGLGLSSGLSLLVASWFANGLFQAGLFPAGTNSISKWFSAGQRGFASGCLASSMSLGSTAASSIAAVLVTHIGWRWAFALFGGVGLIWAAAFFRAFHDRPEDDPRVSDEERNEIHRPLAKSPVIADDSPEESVWLSLLLSPATWVICGQQFCRAGGQIFFSTWFATYLQEARGISVLQSGLLTSLPLCALVVGPVIGGMVSDRVLTITGSRRWGRKGVASCCMFLCAAFVFGSCVVRDPLLAVLTISAGTLIGSIGGPAAYAITIDMGGRHIAKLFGCMNMVGNLGAAAVSFGVPQFLSWKNDQWDQVLVLFGILWIAAGVFWLLLDPEGNVFRYSWWKSRTGERKSPS